MSKYYRVELSIGKQEDGLWRIETPALNGCWVDAETLEQGIAEAQEVIAMTLLLYEREEWELPKEVTKTEGLPTTALIPIVLEEYTHIKIPETARQA